MTTSTTDAEAIARIIEDRPFEEDYQKGSAGAFSARGRKEAALRKAECILSYLASRREAQEPVAWLRRPKGYKGGLVSVHTQSKPNDGDDIYEVLPVYTAHPSPAPAGISDDQIIAIWRAAMTASCNMVIGRQNRLNDDDGPCDVLNEQGEIASQIKRILEPDELYIGEIRQMIGAVPAPAGEVERLVKPIIDRLEWNGRLQQWVVRPDLPAGTIKAVRAALNGGRSDG